MINDVSLALVKEYEGCVLTAYPDPATKNDKRKKGFPWTIGYGHTGLMSGVLVKPGDVITKEKADEFLKQDLEQAVILIQEYVKVPLNENQYGALASFVFNLGERNFKKSSVLRYINAKRFNEVPGRLALYRMGNGKVMPGLVRRRAAEGDLWLTPVGTKTEAKKEVVLDKKEAQGVTVTPASTKKPWDLGVVGTFVTFLATQSDQVKKFVGNFTDTFHIPALWLLIAVALGFAGYTLYNKWKDR